MTDFDAETIAAILSLTIEDVKTGTDSELTAAWLGATEMLARMRERLSWVEDEAGARTQGWDTPLKGDTVILQREWKTTHGYDDAAIREEAVPILTDEQRTLVFQKQPDKFYVSEIKKAAKTSPALKRIVESHHKESSRPGPIEAVLVKTGEIA